MLVNYFFSSLISIQQEDSVIVGGTIKTGKLFNQVFKTRLSSQWSLGDSVQKPSVSEDVLQTYR